MSLRLKDHVALITGASRGIGRASAIALAAEGAKIVGVARTKAELDTLVAQITSTGGAAIAVVADVTKSADVAPRITAPARNGSLSVRFTAVCMSSAVKSR